MQRYNLLDLDGLEEKSYVQLNEFIVANRTPYVKVAEMCSFHCVKPVD